MNDSFLSRCEALLGADHIDRTLDPPVLVPHTGELLCEAVRLINNERLKISIIGGGTSPVPRAGFPLVPVSTAGLSGVTEVNPADFNIIARAGTTVDRAVDEAAAANLLLPLDIISGSRATVGGAFMTGAVAPSDAGYGPFRKAVTGIRCVSAEGKVVRFGGRTTKNVTGYDITWFLGGTLGLYAIATELIIKVHPLPESRIVAVARMQTGPVQAGAVLTRLSALPYRTSLELVAPEGMAGVVTVAVGIEGMAPLVDRSRERCRELLDTTGTIEYREDAPDAFFREFRRQAAEQLVGSGLLTISIPPAAAGSMLERLSAIAPEAPVIAHPILGRFHVSCSGAADELGKMSLAIGGKKPVSWGEAFTGGLSGLFTDGELTIARALKRELDPDGILNPHLKLL